MHNPKLPDTTFDKLLKYIQMFTIGYAFGIIIGLIAITIKEALQ
jgi:hypothetical protein